MYYNIMQLLVKCFLCVGGELSTQLSCGKAPKNVKPPLFVFAQSQGSQGWGELAIVNSGGGGCTFGQDPSNLFTEILKGELHIQAAN